MAIGLPAPTLRAAVLTEVAGALAFAGRVAEAQAVGAGIADAQQRTGALYMIAMALARAGRAATARAVLDGVRDPRDPGMPELFMVSIIRALAEAKQTAGWRELTATIRDQQRRASALDAVVTSLMKQGKVSEALATVNEDRDTRQRALTLSATVASAVQAGKNCRGPVHRRSGPTSARAGEIGRKQHPILEVRVAGGPKVQA